VKKSTLKLPFNRVTGHGTIFKHVVLVNKNNRYKEVQVRGLNYICHIDSKCKITELKKWYSNYL